MVPLLKDNTCIFFQSKLNLKQEGLSTERSTSSPHTLKILKCLLCNIVRASTEHGRDSCKKNSFQFLINKNKQKQSSTLVIWSPWIILWKHKRNAGLNSSTLTKENNECRFLHYMNISKQTCHTISKQYETEFTSGLGLKR